jgi:hypothetical protein
MRDGKWVKNVIWKIRQKELLGRHRHRREGDIKIGLQ